jgi:hypothetical protein
MTYLIELLLGWLIGKRNGWTPDDKPYSWDGRMR